ncbi:hypothetical protein HAX54_000454 [Datura stramonium]|uniref:K Homology domain-containing protein n=1 Tax=Datura stramonium TaxID=4076 RepID=A0ABS8T1Q9_DATST|nr:hypothetical protein [Datura stramonium]
MISAKEESSLSIPPAMDGLLKFHKQIVDVDTDSANAPPGVGRPVTTRLLVAASQAGNLIGKQGSTINSIQDTSHCTIRVIGEGASLFNLVILENLVLTIDPLSFVVHYCLGMCGMFSLKEAEDSLDRIKIEEKNLRWAYDALNQASKGTGNLYGHWGRKIKKTYIRCTKIEILMVASLALKLGWEMGRIP